MLPSSLLISLRSVDELELLSDFAFPWIDLKDPLAGPLGCPSPSVASAFLASAERMLDRSQCQISIALGELVDESWSGLAETASNYDFAKVAMAGCAAHSDWKVRAERLATEIGGKGRLILVHYADRHIAAAPDWNETLEVAAALSCRFILIDTFDKSAGRLWDWYPPETVRQLASDAQSMGLELSIAGSLRLDDLPWARNLGAKIVGVRSAACRDGSRLHSLCHDRLKALSEIFSNQVVTN